MSAGSRRLIATVLVGCVTLFAFEGVVTTFSGQSLLRRLPLPWTAPASAADPAGRTHADEERLLAAARNPGLLRLHPDPLVGYVLRPGTELDILGGKIRTDALGLRARPRPWPDGDPLVIVLTGASIPFGFGLSDEDTIANRLEELLEASRGPGARPIVCRTVAMARWSTRNAVSCILDHFAELRPDIVVYMSFPNDCSDSDIVSEAGFREAFPDPASADPWLPVRADQSGLLVAKFRRGEAGTRLQPDDYGADALTADISPESRRRYDESAQRLVHLAEVLRARGGELMVMPIIRHEHGWQLLSRLWRALPDLPAAPLLSNIPSALTLGHDPHPNAQTAFALATLVAQALLDQGLVDRGAGQPLPKLARRFEALREPAFTPSGVMELSAEARAQARSLLRSSVDFTTGHGVEQVFGGVSVSGIVGTRALLLLAPAGPALDLTLAPVAERPDLYPLEIAVEVDGAPAGVVTLTAAGPVTARLALPQRADPEAPLEVKLIAPRWVVERIDGGFELVAFRPVRVSCVDG